MKIIKENFNEDSFNEIVEGGTSRIYSHITDDDKFFAIISPYRTEYSESENKSRFSKLKNEVKSLGFGYIPFVSRWSEMDDDGNVLSSDEQSLMIPGMDVSTAIKLGSEYEQDSIIVKDSESCREIATKKFTSWDGNNYNIGETVRTFNVKSDKPLNISDAEDIFAKRKAGPSSKSQRGGNQHPFYLSELYEVEEPKPSYFQSISRKKRIL